MGRVLEHHIGVASGCPFIYTQRGVLWAVYFIEIVVYTLISMVCVYAQNLDFDLQKLNSLKVNLCQGLLTFSFDHVEPSIVADGPIAKPQCPEAHLEDVGFQQFVYP
jgi:hypothetical protein